MKNSLLQKLDHRFREHDFNRTSDKFLGDRYDRFIPGGRQSVSLSVYKRKSFIELDSPYISIRLNAVEDTINRFEEPSPFLRPIDIQARSTIGLRLEPTGIAGIFRKSWNIRDESDARATAEEFVPFVMTKANVFWLRFSKPEEILKAFSGESTDSGDYVLPEVINAKKVLALVMVLKGAEAAKKIANEKLGTLKEESREELKQWTIKAFAL